MLQPRLRLVSSSRLVNTDDEEWMERENKCLDCCPVVGCETCGQCEQHPVTDAGIAELFDEVGGPFESGQGTSRSAPSKGVY